jgi:hypothetical protein
VTGDTCFVTRDPWPVKNIYTEDEESAEGTEKRKKEERKEAPKS